MIDERPAGLPPRRLPRARVARRRPGHGHDRRGRDGLPRARSCALHARDAASADRDLREALGLRRTALGGAAPAGALMFTCNGRGRGMFGVADHDAAALADGARGGPDGRVLRRGRDRARRRRELPARLHRPLFGSVRAVKLSGRTVLLTGATGGIGHAIARTLAERGARARAHRPAHRGARAARRRDRRARASPPTWPTAAAVARADRAAAATSTCSSPTRRCRRPGRLCDFSDERDRPRARRQPARADRARPRARAADDRRAARPPRLHLLAVGQGGDAGAAAIYSATKFGLRGFALGPARGPARHRRRRVDGLPRLHPRRGHVRRGRGRAAPGVGTRTPEEVAEAVVTRDRAQPRRGRRGAARPARWARRSRALAPGLGGCRLDRRLGRRTIAGRSHAAGQRSQALARSVARAGLRRRRRRRSRLVGDRGEDLAGEARAVRRVAPGWR